MALSSTDLIFYYTGAGSTTDTTSSLGGTNALANTIPDATAQNVYDDVTGDESETGDTEYRCIAMKDTNATYDYINCKMWIDGCVRDSSIAARDTVSFVIEQASGGTCQSVATESAAPAEEFTVPLAGGTTHGWTIEDATDTNPSGTQEFGTLDSGTWTFIWLRRQVPANANAYSNRASTIKWQGETTGSPRMILEKTWVVGWTGDGLSIYEHIGETE